MNDSIVELGSVSRSQCVSALSSICHLEQPRILIRRPELGLPEIYWDTLVLPFERQGLLRERDDALKHALFASYVRCRDIYGGSAVCLGPAGAVDGLYIEGARALAADVWQVLKEMSEPGYRIVDGFPDPVHDSEWGAVPWRSDPVTFNLHFFYS